MEALGVAGSPAPNRLTTTFRLSGGVLVDAGAAAHAIEPADRKSITDVLLSHSHLDHTLGLPFLLGTGSVRVWGLEETLDAVRQSLLDGRIWPDLRAHADWRTIRPCEPFSLGPWRIDTAPSSHTVPCLSYALRGFGRTLVIVGDTRYDAAVAGWTAAARPDDCVVECSYPDAKAEEAVRFGHQCPRDLRRWREAIGPTARIHATHLKPAYEAATLAGLEGLRDPLLSVLRDGDVLPG